MDETIDRDGFREWLLAQDGDAEVGVRANTCDCPLANYLRQSGYPEAVICKKLWYPHEDSIGVRLPEFALKFIRRVDDFPDLPDADPRDARPVSADEALYALQVAITAR